MAASVLLVEGTDDEHVVKHMLAHEQVPETLIKIKQKQGITLLIESLSVELKGGGLKQLGIILDADLDPAARWAQLRRQLALADYTTVPATPDRNGTIIQEADLPVVGIWMMPDNAGPGILEDFVHLLVPENDSLWPQAIACLDHIPEAERRFPPAQRSKALIHTWLAWQAEPGRPLGTAITAHYLDAGRPSASQFMDWARRLFGFP